jgi:hypothetical protein
MISIQDFLANNWIRRNLFSGWNLIPVSSFGQSHLKILIRKSKQTLRQMPFSPLCHLSHGRFYPLHLHTTYSMLDGAIRIPDLMKKVKELGMSSVAITDHGNMYGAIEFYKEAVKHEVKPIIGCEFM